MPGPFAAPTYGERLSFGSVVNVWHGCLRGQRATRSTPRRWLRLFFTATTPGRRLRLRNVVAAAFESRAAYPARASPRGELAHRPRGTRALADLALLASRPTRDALHPTPLAEVILHRYAASSAAAALNRVVTCWTPVPRDPRALRPVENRPTFYEARARWRTLRSCLRGQSAPRSTPRRWPRLFFTVLALGRRRRH